MHMSSDPYQNIYYYYIAPSGEGSAKTKKPNKILLNYKKFEECWSS